MRKPNVRLFFQWSLGILVVSYGLLLFALNNMGMQQRLANLIEQQLEEKLQSEVEIGSVEIGLLNSIQLHDVLLKDRQGKELLKSKLFFCKIEIYPLIKGEVSLRNIALLDAHISLYKHNKGAATNFQYIIDAFSSKDKDKTSKFNLRINSLIMRRCDLSYDEWYHPQAPVGQFTPHHLNIKNIDAILSLKCLTNDSINLRIRQFSAQESCGWKLSRLQLCLAANRHMAEIKDFSLQTLQSRISQERLVAHYDGSSLDKVFNSLIVEGAIEDARLATNDLAHIAPNLHQLNEIIFISTHFALKKGQVKLRNLHLSNATDRIKIDTDATILLPNGKFSSVSANLRNLTLQQRFARDVMQSITLKELPLWLNPLEDIQLQGKLRYAMNHSSFFEGSINSSLGKIDFNTTYWKRNLTAHILSRNLRPSILEQIPNLPTHLNIEAHGHVFFNDSNQPNGHIELNIPEVEWHQRRYQKLEASASFFNGVAEIGLQSQDPSLHLNIDAKAALDNNWHPSLLIAKGQVKRLSPAELGLSKQWGNGLFAFDFDIKAPQLDVKHPNAEVELRQFSLQNVDAPYFLNRLALKVSPHPRGSHLTLQSDFADATALGIADWNELQTVAEKWWKTLLKPQVHSPNPTNYAQVSPTLSKEREKEGELSANKTALAFNLHIKRTDFLQRLFKLDIAADKEIRAEGRLAADGSMLHFTADAPHLRFGTTEVRNITMAARSQHSNFRMLVKALRPMKNADLQLELQAHTDSGRLMTNLQWSELQNHHFYGIFSSETHIDALNINKLKESSLRIKILPTSLAVNDTIWNIEPGSINLQEGRLNINNLSLSHAQQRLAISGEYAQHSEGLAVNMRQFDVGYALSMIGLSDIIFGGRATGQATIRPTELNELQILANLDIPQFTFNNALLGHASIEGGFRGGDQTIFLKANIEEPNISSTQVAGYVSLGRKDLDLHIKANNTSVAFLNHYVDDIFHNIQGRTTGTTRVFGTFKAIDFEGRQHATASLTLPVTGVKYFIKDADIAIAPGVFSVNSAVISDSLQGNGTITGSLRHHNLKDMHFDFAMQGEKILMYDQPQTIDLPFYATAFGTGSVRVWGAPQQLNANIQVRTENNSVLTYVLDQPDDADHQLLTFRSKQEEGISEVNDSLQQTRVNKPAEPTSKTNIRLNFQVDVTPNSTLRMVTDAKSGDVITVHGSGPIQASFYNKGEFKMFGAYKIASGSYDLSIQNFIKKTFTLTPGGTVNFSGNPLNADVNILASYMINSASLADLNIGTNFTNNTTPVNCLIKFTGKVNNMNLTLDFDLPNVGEDEKMMVRNLIASDEERTTQVLYLLGVGRFFTYNYANVADGTKGSQSEIMMKSLLSSTLSSHLNNIIANAVGNTNWSFGANVSTGQLGWSDMEVDGLLSGRLLDNRLQFTGKVGYHEREAATTNFVGDFNVHYLLTPTGTVNLKAYSETNNRYFSKSTLTTQGLGLQIKRDFNSFFDLFSRKRKDKTTIKVKK